MAPGLIALMQDINTATGLCAVIGNPVEHSLSPVMHNAAFAAMKLNIVYLAFRVEDVAGCIRGMKALHGFRGLSVTIPHKSAVMEHLDSIDDMALHVGSVNTISCDNGRLIGYTTDGPGAVRAFDDAGVPLQGRDVLLLGSGGAVRAVAFALLEQAGVARLTIAGRTAERVRGLVNDLKEKAVGNVDAASIADDLPACMGSHEVIIQGTPTGMYSASVNKTLIPKKLLRPHHVVFDMVYRPMNTRLLQEAREAGCHVILGLEMLLNQAALQFEIWFGKPAPRHVMRQALMKALNETGS